LGLGCIAVHLGCTNWSVQPGCTILGLSAQHRQRTSADHGVRAACNQRWTPAEDQRSMGTIPTCHLVIGEQNTNLKSLIVAEATHETSIRRTKREE
jgi:hypothetical protein